MPGRPASASLDPDPTKETAVSTRSPSATDTRQAPTGGFGHPDPGAGWVALGGIILLVLGTMNLIEGIGAVGDSAFFVGGAKFVFGSLHAWGWVAIVLGVGQLATGIGVLAGSRAAAWLGVGFATGNMVAQLLFLPAYPFLSISLFALDVLVVYGLAVHGGRRAAA
jgi:hypothetical protein